MAGGLLAGTCLTFYVILSRVLTAQFEQRLVGAIQPVAADLVPEPDDLNSLDSPLDDDVTKLNIPGEYFELLASTGRLLQESANLGGRQLDFGKLPLSVSGPIYRTFDDGGRGPMRSVLVPVQRGPDRRLLLLAMPSADIDQALTAFRRLTSFLLSSALLLTGLLSVWYVNRSLRPIADLTRHAAAMAQNVGTLSGGQIWTPLSTSNPDDEVGRLTVTFNHLFDRISAVVQQLRQFVTDASHELRTPLTVLRGETELVLSAPREAEEYRESLLSVDSEIKKLSMIVANLFTLSMADAGQLSIMREPIFLNEVLEQACAVALPLARTKRISIKRQLDGELPYLGDESVLRQLFLIFLDNAIRYSPPDTQVSVALDHYEGQTRATFSDEGFGISAEHQPHIFERFYRVASGSRYTDSGGLGLSIAQALTRAHGGAIQCTSTVGHGSTFTVSLPPSTCLDKSKLILD